MRILPCGIGGIRAVPSSLVRSSYSGQSCFPSLVSLRSMQRITTLARSMGCPPCVLTTTLSFVVGAWAWSVAPTAASMTKIAAGRIRMRISRLYAHGICPLLGRGWLDAGMREMRLAGNVRPEFLEDISRHVEPDLLPPSAEVVADGAAVRVVSVRDPHRHAVAEELRDIDRMSAGIGAGPEDLLHGVTQAAARAVAFAPPEVARILVQQSGKNRRSHHVADRQVGVVRAEAVEISLRTLAE